MGVDGARNPFLHGPRWHPHRLRGRRLGAPLVKAPNWLTRLEFEWSSPVWRHWWEELAKHHTLVRFDQRGLVRFNLLGISQGGAMSTKSTPAGTVSRPGSSAGPATAYCRMAE